MLPKLIRALIVIGPAVLVVTVVWLRQVRQAQQRRSDAADAAVDALCLVASSVALLWFFRFGAISWDRLDWPKDGTYYSSLQDAVLRGRMPFYLSVQIQDTNRYWANLEAPLGPHVVLLGVMGVNAFFLLHVLLMFTIGYAALAAWRREAGMSSFTFVVFVALFLFNGHITSHLSAGHTQWTGYFLLPWMFLCLTRAARGDCSIRNGVTLALALGGMVAIGAWHIFVWSFLFTLFFCATSWVTVRFLARVSILLAAVSMFRVLPALLTFGGGSNQFLTGFNSARMIFDALAIGRTQSFARESLAWWEFDMYIGAVGFALLCLGLWPWRERDRWFLNRFYVPIAGLILLSIGRVYGATLFRLPGFVSERISTRMLIVPVLALLWMGCVRFDRWFARRVRGRRLVALGALVGACLLVAQLLVNTLRWRLPAAGVAIVPQSVFLEAFPVEGAYFWSVWGGSVLSLLVLGLMGRSLIRGTATPPAS